MCIACMGERAKGKRSLGRAEGRAFGGAEGRQAGPQLLGACAAAAEPGRVSAGARFDRQRVALTQRTRRRRPAEGTSNPRGGDNPYVSEDGGHTIVDIRFYEGFKLFGEAEPVRVISRSRDLLIS